MTGASTVPNIFPSLLILLRREKKETVAVAAHNTTRMQSLSGVKARTVLSQSVCLNQEQRTRSIILFKNSTINLIWLANQKMEYFDKGLK